MALGVYRYVRVRNQPMNTRQMQREVANEVGRDISFRDGLIPAWTNDFTQQGVQNGLSFTRASNAGYVNNAGDWVIAGSDVPRMDHYAGSLTPKGFLSEEARTNFLLNSMAPATQTVSLTTGVHVLTLSGTGTCTCAAGTATGTGFGVANEANAVTFTLATAGTVVFTVSGSVSRFQCEKGAFPTSFIATTSSAATRSADVCGGTIAGIINPAEGTFVATCTVGQGGGMVLGLDDGSGGGSTRAHFSAIPTARGLYVMIGGGMKGNIQATNVLAAGGLLKIAFSYSAAGLVCAVNGQITGSSASASANFNVASLRVGCRYFPSAMNQLNGHVQKISYYPAALSNAQLQQLTE